MGISIWQLLIVLVIVIVLFGTKRLRNIGTDLGGAIKGFKNAVGEGSEDDQTLSSHENDSNEDNVSSKENEKS